MTQPGPELADTLGVTYHRFKDWVKKGYVPFREAARRGNLMIWANAEEPERLGRLRDYPRPGRSNRYPDELTRPKVRSASSGKIASRLLEQGIFGHSNDRATVAASCSRERQETGHRARLNPGSARQIGVDRRGAAT
jgi:hypothetical protein